MNRSLVGRVVAGRFAIESLIGSGAMGAVYRARHLGLDKLVAVKVLHEDFGRDPMFSARLQREAKAASRLDHPNSVRVIDFGEEPDGLLYIAMELLDGVDLQTVLQRDWPLAEARIVDLLSQVLSALAVAHDLGIVHRDLKPDNIMVLQGTDDEGRPREVVKVCDFGVAKISEPPESKSGGDAAFMTTQGIVVGTPAYMSPEQCRGEALDARSDIYALGVVLYELLARQAPFQADSIIDVLFKHVSEEPVPPGRLRSGVSPHLERVCLRAMRKARADRYGTAAEMRADLRSGVGLAESARNLPAADAARGDEQRAGETVPAAKRRGESVPPAAGDVARRSIGGVVSDNARPRRRARYVTVTVAVLAVAGIALALSRGRRAPTPPLVIASAAPALAGTPPVEATASARPPSEPPTRDGVVAAAAPAPAGATARARARTSQAAATLPAPVAQASETRPPATEAPPQPVVAAAAPAPEPAPARDTAVRPAPPPAPAPQPAPPRLDPAKGNVAWSVSDAGGGATVTSVGRAIARAASSWQRCYQSGLAARGERAQGTGSLRLRCDDQGRVVSATLSGFDLPDVAGCIRSSVVGVTIPGADTGEAWAAVSVAFKVAE